MLYRIVLNLALKWSAVKEKIPVLCSWLEVLGQISDFEILFTQLYMIEVESTGDCKGRFVDSLFQMVFAIHFPFVNPF